MLLNVRQMGGFRHRSGPVVLRRDDCRLLLDCRNACLGADRVRRNVHLLVVFPGYHLVRLDAGGRTPNVVVAVASVDRVPLDGKKEPVVILPDKGHYCCVVALERHCYEAEWVDCQVAVALERQYCCVVALEHQYCCVVALERHCYEAERVDCQGVVARLHCYVVVLIAHYSRLVADLRAVAESRDVVGLLHLYPVVQQEALLLVA